MKKVEVDGHKYKVVENMGYNHDIGMRAILIETDDGNKVVVSYRVAGPWRFWTPRDRLSGGKATRAVGM